MSKLEYAPILEALKHYYPSHPFPPSPRLSGWDKMLCPVHDDTHASASINIGKNTWACMACDINETSLGLIMREEGVVPSVAAQRQKELFGVGERRVEKRSGRPGIDGESTGRGSLF